MGYLYKARIPLSILSAIISIQLATYADEVRPTGANAYEMITGDDAEGVRRNWDRIYNGYLGDKFLYGKEPSEFLKKSMSYLKPGRVLDIAMGEGRNSVFLAKKGFSVEGVDISEVALRKSKRLARENGVIVSTILADLNNYAIKPNSYEVILNFDYLQKNLVPQIKRGLKKGGIIIYQNFTTDQLSNQEGQNMRRDYLLKKGELKELFSDFDILVYQETNDGHEAKASLVARKM